MKKVKNIFGGVIGGIIFIILGIGLLWWNESNNVKNIKTIEEARSEVINISNEKVDSSNEGKLVSTNGKISISEEYLLDSMFNVKSPQSLKMVRVVEMYQWEEDTETQNDKTVYVYNRDWSSELIKSNNFNDKSRTNPSTMPYTQETYLASEVTLGAFTISDEQKRQMPAKKNVTLDETLTLPTGYKIYGNYITNSTNPDSPAIGDIRISFLYNEDLEVSVLAMQKGNGFADYVSEQGKVLNVMVAGNFTGEEMIGQVEEQNNFLKIVLRIVGSLFVIVGFCGILSPVSNLISLIPLFGKHISGFINFIGFMIGLAVSLVVIAIAWITFRPVVGICLLVGVGIITAIVVVLISKSRKKAANQPPQGVYSSSQAEAINQQFTQSNSPNNQNLNYASVVDANNGAVPVTPNVSASSNNGQVMNQPANVQPTVNNQSSGQPGSLQSQPVAPATASQENVAVAPPQVVAQATDQDSIFEQLQTQAAADAQEEELRAKEAPPTNSEDIFAQFQSGYVDTSNDDQAANNGNNGGNQ